MGKSSAIVGAEEIVEGLPLTCDDLAAVVAWNDLDCHPLLRIHPRYHWESARIRIFAWAAAALTEGRRLAVLSERRASEVLDASP